jgi:hypothetical protein
MLVFLSSPCPVVVIGKMLRRLDACEWVIDEDLNEKLGYKTHLSFKQLFLLVLRQLLFATVFNRNLVIKASVSACG